VVELSGVNIALMDTILADFNSMLNMKVGDTLELEFRSNKGTKDIMIFKRVV
jgi:hypothetical protein